MKTNTIPSNPNNLQKGDIVTIDGYNGQFTFDYYDDTTLTYCFLTSIGLLYLPDTLSIKRVNT